MVRKAVFDRAEIISAAYEVVAQHGFDQLTARRVADELGSSTAPVYSNFANMEELEQATVDQAVDRILEFTRRPWTDNPFFNVGIGVLEFIYQSPRWYQALFMLGFRDRTWARRLTSTILEDMGRDPGLGDLPEIERTVLLKKMTLFTHGLATQFCAGCPDCPPREEFIAMLGEVGSALVRDAKDRAARTDGDPDRFPSVFASLHTDKGEGDT